jgi:hypothetical protein
MFAAVQILGHEQWENVDVEQPIVREARSNGASKGWALLQPFDHFSVAVAGEVSSYRHLPGSGEVMGRGWTVPLERRVSEVIGPRPQTPRSKSQLPLYKSIT